MLQKLRNNKEGFTLIELMIVIAIIGILAAIAIPNFIAYRDKAYCSAAETDVQTVMGAIADYFADPNHTAVTQGDLSGVNLSYNNKLTLTDNGNNSYTVEIFDTSGRCPRFNTVSETM